MGQALLRMQIGSGEAGSSTLRTHDLVAPAMGVD
jgi:hypothetical protein